MIENWDDLVDPQTLAFYNLGPDPSLYVLRQIGIEGKKVSIFLVGVNSTLVHLGSPVKCFLLAEMTTKFNKDMYAKMRCKKDESLSNLRKKAVRVTGKGPSVNPLGSVIPIVSAT